LQLFFLQKTQKMPTLLWKMLFRLHFVWLQSPPPSPTFPENFFRCPFHYKSAPRNRPPPLPNLLMLPTPLTKYVLFVQASYNVAVNTIFTSNKMFLSLPPTFSGTFF
jgi:hypothetical protein